MRKLIKSIKKNESSPEVSGSASFLPVSFFRKKLKSIRRQEKEFETAILAVIVLLAIFLRFYEINKLHFFTYDQARDAIYVKRIVANHIPRLLGTQTSLPGMYLPPFYYYTIAPVLWLARLNPIGIDIYSASIGVLAVILVYWVANQMFGKPAGIVSAALYSVSPLNVELSRRAWNPNTLPFFILLAFYFLWRFWVKKKERDFLFATIVYGYCLSLHFGAWTLAPIFLFSWLYLFKKKGSRKILLGSIAAISFFIAPLILFELRHNFFLLSQAKVFFFDKQHLGLIQGNFIESILTSVIAIFTILLSGRILVGAQAPFEFSGKLSDLFRFSQPISVVAQKPFSLSFQWWGMAILGLIIFLTGGYLFKGKKRAWKLSLILLWTWVLVGVVIAQFYAGKFFFFYYLFLFPVPFLLLGFVAKVFWRSSLGRLLVVISVLTVVSFHVRYTAVFQDGWRDINDLHRVAKVIAKDAPKNVVFNIASARREADRWDRNAVDYQYFIETFYERQPLDWLPEDYEKAEILYFVSESGLMNPLNSPIMEVQKFKPKEILETWELPKNIVIYKLGR